MDLSGYDGQAAPAVILQATPDQEVGGPGYHGGVAGKLGFKDHALEEAVGVFEGEEHGASAGAHPGVLGTLVDTGYGDRDFVCQVRELMAHCDPQGAATFIIK